MKFLLILLLCSILCSKMCKEMHNFWHDSSGDFSIQFSLEFSWIILNILEYTSHRDFDYRTFYRIHILSYSFYFSIIFFSESLKKSKVKLYFNKLILTYGGIHVFLFFFRDFLIFLRFFKSFLATIIGNALYTCNSGFDFFFFFNFWKKTFFELLYFAEIVTKILL